MSQLVRIVLTCFGAGSVLLGAGVLAPAEAPGPSVVSAIYPSRATLPENLLKFYIYFSAPMSRGEAYQRIHLLNEKGKEVESPFLELPQELWDDRQTRFTLLLDPGRIKRELLPRELVGPALENGKKYTLVIDRTWLDADNKPLKESHRKAFTVGPPDEKVPDIKSWKLTPPSAGSLDPLIVDFPEPLDHAMLHRVLQIMDSRTKPLEGTIAVSREETRWEFKPKAVWQAGAYHLDVDSDLEDLAGNSLKKPFEVDLFKKVDRKVMPEQLQIGFTLR
jgi:hypothetical protein